MEKYILNLAGEYRVCAEILKRGIFATVTMGNLKAADIHIIVNKHVYSVEVKTTNGKRFVTSFFQKYKAPELDHPDFWILCHLDTLRDRFFILTHEELARVQSNRNSHSKVFDWLEEANRSAKGVDNVLIDDIEIYENQWDNIESLLIKD